MRRRDAFLLSRFRTVLGVLVLLPIIPVLGLHLYRNLEQRKTEKSLLTERVVTLSRLIAANESSYIKHARQQLATLAEFSFLVLTTNREFCTTHLENLLKLSPDYLNFGLIESDGTLFASALDIEPEQANFSDRSYFRRAVESRRFAVGEFQVGRISGRRSLNSGFPIFGHSNEVKRVLFSSLKLDLLTEAAASIPLPEGAAVTVLDRAGTVLARLPETGDWVGKSLLSSPFVARSLETRDGVIESAGLDGVQRVYSVTSVSDGVDPSLFVAVGIPTNVLFGAANEKMLANILFLSTITVLSLLIASLVAERTLIQPVKHLVDAAHALAEGDLTSRVRARQHNTELRELAAAFNSMAERLQKREEELQAASREIQQMNAVLESKVRDRTEQLESANRELEAFSYSVSHDLRAPLRHLDGFAQLLLKNEREQLSDKGVRYLDVIVKAAKKMGTLIDELLMFSRMGRQALNRSTLDFNKLVEEVRIEVEAQAAGKPIDWKIDDLPEVNADRALFHQVWLNLLSNAVKYSATRPAPSIQIGSSSSAGEQNFFVRDNGVGFDMKYADKLFGVFQRLHSEADFEGTGIGLANVRRIVHRHGGRVWAEGKPGEGATFYFSLPYEHAS